jgi:hypothetical protein
VEEAMTMGARRSDQAIPTIDRKLYKRKIANSQKCEQSTIIPKTQNLEKGES